MKKTSALLVIALFLGCSCQRSQFATTARTYRNGKVTYTKKYHRERRKVSKALSDKDEIKYADRQPAGYSDYKTNVPREIVRINPAIQGRAENLIASTTKEFAFAPDQGNIQNIKCTEYIAGNGYFSPDTISKVDKKKAGEVSADSSDNRKVEKLGLAGFILSIGGLVPVVCLPLAILGVIFGSISLRKIKRNPALYKGKGFAITSIILGILGILGILLFIG
jgi:hypothetical protein